MPDCLFCKVRDGQLPAQLTYQDDDVVAFKDIKPQAPLHQLVIPRRHIESLAASSADDATILGKLMLAGAKIAKDAGFGEQGFRVVMNSGPAAGQTVFHVHLHVLAGRDLSWPPG